MSPWTLHTCINTSFWSPHTWKLKESANLQICHHVASYIPNLSANYAFNFFTKHRSDNRIFHGVFAIMLNSYSQNISR